MRPKFRMDQAISLFFIALGISIFIQTFKFKAFVELNVPGPAVVPRAVAAMMVLFSTYTLIASLLGRSPVPKPIHDAARRPMLVTAVLGFGYAALVPIIGFYSVSTILPFLFHLWVSEEETKLSGKPLRTAILFSIGLSAFLYLVFAVVLKVKLPKGVLI